MLSTHQKFRMMDRNNKSHYFDMEVNWNKDPDIQECRILKVTSGKDIYFIPRKELQEMLFAIGMPEDQRKMIPQTLEKVRWYETVVGVKATKNIAKGEMMNFPIKISLPSVKEEIIGELKNNKSNILVP